MAGVGQLFGVSPWITVPIVTALMLGLAFSGSYRRVEKIGIAVGLAELAFIPAMILAHPRARDVVHGLGTVPFGQHSYVFLLAANVGAVVMPWMIFYQQSAVVQKGLKPHELKAERRDTAVGSVITQGIMIVVIVAFAATVFKTNRTGSQKSVPLNTVGQLVGGLSSAMGSMDAKVLVGAAILGGALVAAIVVSLAGSWGIAEVLGWKHSLGERVNRRNWKFYAVYALAHVAGAAIVLASFDLVGLAVG